MLQGYPRHGRQVGAPNTVPANNTRGYNGAHRLYQPILRLHLCPSWELRGDHNSEISVTREALVAVGDSLLLFAAVVMLSLQLCAWVVVEMSLHSAESRHDDVGQPIRDRVRDVLRTSPGVAEIGRSPRAAKSSKSWSSKSASERV
jgi:hypothetical protein